MILLWVLAQLDVSFEEKKLATLSDGPVIEFAVWWKGIDAE